MDLRHRRVFHRLFSGPPTGRLELARHLGITPNAAGDVVREMIASGLIRECAPVTPTRGRPGIPLEIDLASRQMLGVALYHGKVELAHANLRGQLLRPPVIVDVPEPAKLVRAAQRAIARQLTRSHFAIGVIATGFVDPAQKRLLLSSAIAGIQEADLQPLYEAAGELPLYLQNDMQAMAARWLLAGPADPNEDALIILLADGQVGSAVLVAGKPSPGCVLGGNELGHMRFPIPTDRCYCGQIGCLERIFSSEFARARLGLVGSLPKLIAAYDGRRTQLSELLQLTASGLANAINFLRPHRMVLISPYSQNTVFMNDLLRRTRELLLAALADRVRFDLWEQPAASHAETAAYLPLAAMCLDGWARQDALYPSAAGSD